MGRNDLADARGPWRARVLRTKVERLKLHPESCFLAWGLVLSSGGILPFDAGRCPVCDRSDCELAVFLTERQEGHANRNKPRGGRGCVPASS